MSGTTWARCGPARSAHDCPAVAMHERVAYSAAPERAPLHWPDGARVALWVAPNIEHYEYLPQQVRVRDPWPRVPHPDILGYGLRDYGNRVGVWRLMEVFDRLSLPAPSRCRWPCSTCTRSIAEAMMKRDWEFMSHGLYNTRYHWNLSEDEERAAIDECQAIHRRVTGREMRGLVLARGVEHAEHARPRGRGRHSATCATCTTTTSRRRCRCAAARCIRCRTAWRSTTASPGAAAPEARGLRPHDPRRVRHAVCRGRPQ